MFTDIQKDSIEWYDSRDDGASNPYIGMTWKYHDSFEGRERFKKYVNQGGDDRYNSNYPDVKDIKIRDDRETVVNYYKYCKPRSENVDWLEAIRLWKDTEETKELAGIVLTSIVGFFSQNRYIDNGCQVFQGIISGLQIPLLGSVSSTFVWMASIAWDDLRHELEGILTLQRLGLEWLEVFIGAWECVRPIQIQENLQLFIEEGGLLEKAFNLIKKTEISDRNVKAVKEAMELNAYNKELAENASNSATDTLWYGSVLVGQQVSSTVDIVSTNIVDGVSSVGGYVYSKIYGNLPTETVEMWRASGGLKVISRGIDLSLIHISEPT